MARTASADLRGSAWSRRRIRTLLAGASAVLIALLTGVGVLVVPALRPRPAATAAVAMPARPAPPVAPIQAADPGDTLVQQPMPSVAAAAARPGPLSATASSAPLMLPAAHAVGSDFVATGFPPTPQGALGQLAAIDQAALQSASLDGARAVIADWAVPGGPSGSSWSVVAALAMLLSHAQSIAANSGQLAIVLTPVMGLIKGSVGTDLVVPCVDFELDVTLSQTARGAVADCQRMLWKADAGLPGGGRWLIGAGGEPATPPSVWPDTDTAFAVGYHDLRPEPAR